MSDAGNAGGDAGVTDVWMWPMYDEQCGNDRWRLVDWEVGVNSAGDVYGDGGVAALWHRFGMRT